MLGPLENWDSVDTPPLLSRRWGDEDSVSHMSSAAIKDAYLTACNRGTRIVGGAPCGSYDLFNKTTVAQEGLIEVIFRPVKESKVALPMDHLLKEDDWTFTMRKPIDSPPSGHAIAVKATKLGKLDSLDEDWTTGPSAPSVRAATRLIALTKRAGYNTDNISSAISKRWNVDQSLLEEASDSSASHVSIGRIVGSTSKLTQNVYGIENLGGLFSLMPTGITAKSFDKAALVKLASYGINDELDVEEREHAVDFGRVVTWARTFCALQYAFYDPGVMALKDAPARLSIKIGPDLVEPYTPSMFDLGITPETIGVSHIRPHSDFKRLLEMFNSPEYMIRAMNAIGMEIAESAEKSGTVEETPGNDDNAQIFSLPDLKKELASIRKRLNLGEKKTKFQAKEIKDMKGSSDVKLEVIPEAVQSKMVQEGILTVTARMIPDGELVKKNAFSRAALHEAATWTQKVLIDDTVGDLPGLSTADTLHEFMVKNSRKEYYPDALRVLKSYRRGTKTPPFEKKQTRVLSQMLSNTVRADFVKRMRDLTKTDYAVVVKMAAETDEAKGIVTPAALIQRSLMEPRCAKIIVPNILKSDKSERDRDIYYHPAQIAQETNTVAKAKAMQDLLVRWGARYVGKAEGLKEEGVSAKRETLVKYQCLGSFISALHVDVKKGRAVHPSYSQWMKSIATKLFRKAEGKKVQDILISSDTYSDEELASRLDQSYESLTGHAIGYPFVSLLAAAKETLDYINEDIAQRQDLEEAEKKVGDKSFLEKFLKPVALDVPTSSVVKGDIVMDLDMLAALEDLVGELQDLEDAERKRVLPPEEELKRTAAGLEVSVEVLRKFILQKTDGKCSNISDLRDNGYDTGPGFFEEINILASDQVAGRNEVEDDTVDIRGSAKSEF